MDRIILHVDMDSFYASVEQRENPGLIGLAVVVGSDPKQGKGRGVVSTCSYEARSFGIHSGMPISRAYRLCQDAVFLPVNMALYQEVSCRIMNILRSYADKFQQISVDEAFLDISDRAQNYNEAVQLAGEIKSIIKYREKLTCSIGIAPVKSVAKIASDFDKPDGLTVVEPDKVVEFLGPLKVRKLSGIGRKNEEILTGMGISTLGQLARFNENKLTEIFGKWGLKMQRLALGQDDSEVEESFEIRSISREHTFEEDTDDPAVLIKTLDVITEKVHRSLVHKGYSFGTVSIKVRLEDFTTFTRANTLSFSSQDRDIIKRVSNELLSEFFDGKKIRLLGIKLSNLNKSKLIQVMFDYFLLTF
jgi:DNA polymerase IV (DinB-like DNA polymerase)